MCWSGSMLSFYLLSSALAMGIGSILDLLFGDPVYSFHPVRLMGNWIHVSEKLLRRMWNGTPRRELAGGILLVFAVLIPWVLLPAAALFFAYQAYWLLGFAMESIFCYQLLAARCLRDESSKVVLALKENGLEAAREQLSMIVGRETENLSEAGVLRAAVETVAENASDGAVAPVFYMALLGAPGMFFYKAVNTMDSMVGYKNERYLYFGRAAARLDDILNFIPSRLSALAMIVVCPLLKLDRKGALRTYKRDGGKHESPNSARTESVCAGALGIRLGGPAFYFGSKKDKSWLGDELRVIEPEDVCRANRLFYASFFLLLILLFLLRLSLCFVLF
ncbi:adenosylcobinamide-phosphate synthase CbiB [Anaerolentibacter hominis]|uniref:adenosylcobinamide-phosphate synthase CbiB n=1 Tax=Anaerolentibacter hominis TaxID=3079009 RepID=UPI0031B87DA8